MPGEDTTLDEVVGLLDVNPGEGNDEAGDASGNDNTDVLEDGDEKTDDNSDDSGDADAETGEEPGAQEDGEAEGEAAKAGAGEEPLFTVKIDGKEVGVTRAEAEAGYLRQADYTRKTTEVAETRKTVDAELAEYRKNREQYASILSTIQERIGSPDSEPTAEQWNKLREEDPERYAVEWADFGRRQQQRTSVKAEQDRIAKEKFEEQTTALKTFIADQQAKLLDKLPEWKDPVKATAGMTRVREYAKTIGFTEAELNQAYDHRMIVAVDKARRYDALMAEKKSALKKVSNAPEMPAPGNRAPKVNPKAAKREAAMKNLSKTGKLDLSLLDA